MLHSTELRPGQPKRAGGATYVLYNHILRKIHTNYHDITLDLLGMILNFIMLRRTKNTNCTFHSNDMAHSILCGSVKL